MTPLRVFIGYDSRESIAHHALAHSILRRASIPVSITPLALNQLGSIYKRVRGPTESTEFSLTRFLVPYLSGYEGVSLFMDCDMLCRVDVAALLNEGVDKRSDKSVFVCQHDYTPKSETKFLGQRQTKYPRKNWSSLMMFRNDRCRELTPGYVNSVSGLELHRFAWLKDEDIGSLPLEWNFLVGEKNQSPEPPKILHFTNGGPWIPGYEDVDYAPLWRIERGHMLGK